MCSDSVFVYALTLGLLWMGFHDAIREGDGERVIVYRKFFSKHLKGETAK